jgi:hypothetical protein
MTAFAILIICVVAQILIVAFLGLYFLRRRVRQRREEASRQAGTQPENTP